jgi:hypothetical protein
LTWHIVIIANDQPGPPPEIRLRRALKMLLRTFGLRVLSVHPADSTEGEFAQGAYGFEKTGAKSRSRPESMGRAIESRVRRVG